MARKNKARSIGDEANLAERIATERSLRGLSYEALAKLMTNAGCAIQASAIFKIEKGEPRRRITVDELVAFAQVFAVSVENMLMPMEVIAQARAQNLLKQLDEAEGHFVTAVAQLLAAWAEVATLVDEAPDIFEYISGHQNSRADRWSLAFPESLDYDSEPFREALTSMTQRIATEAIVLAELTKDRPRRVWPTTMDNTEPLGPESATEARSADVVS